jgi:hypothetical protein
MTRNRGPTRRGVLRGAALAAGAAAAAPIRPARAAEMGTGALAFSRNLPVLDPVDVLVCGGGPSGVAAALAARRAGARVLLVEARDQLGGTGTSGHVSHWLGGRSGDCRRWIVGGLFRSIAEGAAARGIALLPKLTSTPYQPHGWYQELSAGIPFDPFGMAAYLDERIAEAKADVMLATQALDARVEGGRITHVVLSNKGGLSAVPARAVVDATGDADLAARSGCEVVKGREEDGLMTPASLIFHVSHVDQDSLSEHIHKHKEPRFAELIKRLRAAGEWTFPYDIFISVQLQEKGTMMINTTRLVGVDGIDGASVTRGLIQGRSEAQRLMALMRKHFPGFRDARIKTIAPALGVRETRRIRGPYVLTVDDVAAGKTFDDCIGFSAYGWDLPDPKRPSVNPGRGKKPELTPIPYRILLPRPVTNLTCPGRAVSVERDVLGPLRVMAPCMAMGEAAGQAAAMAAAKGSAFADVDVRALRDALRRHGAVVDA